MNLLIKYWGDHCLFPGLRMSKFLKCTSSKPVIRTLVSMNARIRNLFLFFALQLFGGYPCVPFCPASFRGGRSVEVFIFGWKSITAFFAGQDKIWFSYGMFALSAIIYFLLRVVIVANHIFCGSRQSIRIQRNFYSQKIKGLTFSVKRYKLKKWLKASVAKRRKDFLNPVRQKPGPTSKKQPNVSLFSFMRLNPLMI